jgi:hypothetical protein
MDLTQHIYSLQELDDATRELAAMRIAKNPDWVRYLHSRDGDDLIADFNGAIEYDLMSAPMMGRHPDTHRVMPTLAVAILMAAVWNHEKELLAAEPPDAA